jgi:xanthine dehydrogenase accessory factor
MDVYDEIMDLKRGNRAGALATIVQATGSTPQKAGAKMLVRDDGSIAGTMGGGCIEEKVRRLALLSMDDRETRIVPFDLTETESGLVCGGNLVVFIEPVVPALHLVILGAGHVGAAVAKAARFVGYRTTVIDDRKEYANRDVLPDADEVLVNDFTNPLRGVRVWNETGIVIATRGHANDLDALKAALLTPAGYIGLVGSRRKRSVVSGALVDAGFSNDDIGRIIVPVGIPIGSETPEEIAISIMAQVIEYRRNHAEKCGDSPGCGTIAADGEGKAAAPAR